MSLRLRQARRDARPSLRCTNRSYHTLLTSQPAAVIASILVAALAWVEAAQAQTPTPIVMPCFPSRVIEDAMDSRGLTERLVGAFDDGDLLVVYRNDKGIFVAGFATANGATCLLGTGSGLEMRDHPASKEGS